MRSLRVLILLLVCWNPALGQGTSQRGIEVSDLNLKVDPCSDFFEYSNGTWRANNPIPASMSRWSRRWAASEINKEHLKGILDEVSHQQDWAAGSVEQLIGDHYAACLDEKRINQLGLTPIRPLLADIDAIGEMAGLQRIIVRLHQIAIPVPFQMASTPDPHNPAEVIANISAAGLGLPDRDYYLSSESRFVETRRKYLAHVSNMFMLAGYRDDDARTAAETVFAMEKELAAASLDNVSLRNPQVLDHKTSFAELRKLAPAFDWEAYFQAAKLPQADLNVEQPIFLREVDRQLRETSLSSWKTYLKWHLLHSAAGSLSEPFVEENFSFYGRHLTGAEEMKPRWKRCVESTDALLGEALGKKYVEKYFPPEAKARVRDMVNNLLLAMQDTIEGLAWMGPDTKKHALEKLSTFNPKIGYPDRWKDYSSLKIRRDSYWADVIVAREFNVNDDRAQIGKPVDRGRFRSTPPTSDAYYDPLLNEIVFPAGILQPPAFDMQAPDAVNYGAIGVVIGHEISHGFDDEGAQFDAQGRLHNWWTPDDLRKFQERGQCVVKQFDNYYIEPNIHHDGKLVLGEAIGDLAGAKIAHLAFNKSLAGKPPAPVIDGFTPEQQFFIAWGQFRGDEIRPAMQRLMVQSDEHPVSKYRVIGPFSNMPAFQTAFHCKTGSEMVRPPEKRCEVW
jgi:endothelin-converting enzyme/putative endopeptidase